MSNEVTLVSVDFVQRENGAVNTLWFSNRDVKLSDGTIPATILTLAKWGLRGDGILPNYGNGQIQLNNAPSSYGQSRKVSDLLELYTPYNQSVRVYLELLPDSDNLQNITVSAPAYVDQVVSYQVTGGKVTLTLKTSVISDEVLCYEVTEASLLPYIATFNDASQGKYLPVIFSSTPVETLPTRVNNAVNRLNLAYGTIRGETRPGTYTNSVTPYPFDTTTPGDALDFFAQNQKSEYKKIQLNNSTTPVNVAPATSQDGGWILGNGSGSEVLQRVFFVGENARLVTGLRVRMAALNTTQVGVLTVKLYQYNSAQPFSPGDELRNVSLTLSGIVPSSGTANTGLGSTWYDFNLDIAILPTLIEGGGVWVGFGMATQLTNIALSLNADDALPYDNLVRSTNGTAFVGIAYSTGKAVINLYSLYCDYHHNDGDPGFPSSITDINTGLSPALVSYLPWLGSASNPEVADVRSLNVCIATRGIIDDVNGTWTGVASAPIVKPSDIARYVLNLQYDKINAEWQPENVFDPSFMSDASALFTTPTAGNRARQFSGKTRDKTTLNNFLTQIGNEFACSFVATNEGRIGIWPEGAIYSEINNVEYEFTLYDSDIAILSFGGGQRGAIVNSGRAYFKPTITNSAANREIALLGFRDYSDFAELTYNDGELGQSIGYASYVQFGEGILARDKYEYHSDYQSARNFLEVMIRRYSTIDEYVDLQVPAKIILARFGMPQLKQVIGIASTLLPLDQGTDLAPTLGLDPSGNVVQPSFGDSSVILARTYRAQIDSVEYALGDDRIMLLTLRCRLLNNSKELL